MIQTYCQGRGALSKAALVLTALPKEQDTMKKQYQFTDKQYLEYTEHKDQIEALHELGIDPEALAEPLAQVHEKIFNAHRAGHNTLEVEYY